MTIDTYTDSELEKLIEESSPEHLEALVSKFSPKHIATAVTIIPKLSEWELKLNAVISGLTEHPQLETVGKTITHEQMLKYLEFLSSTQNINIDKLSSIFIGMPKETFAFVLRQANPSSQQILKKIGKTEPLQHHLNLLSQSLMKNISDFSTEFGLLDEITEKIEIEDLGFNDIVHMTKRIELLRIAYQLVSEIVERGLALAWHTDRLDLIEKYNSLRSHCQKSLVDIGARGDGVSIKPTGLFALFGGRIMSAYGNPDDPFDVEALKNSDPAIEALAKFSIWYVEDFFEVGLLPDIKSPKELDLNPKNHTEEERAAYRNQLIETAHSNLEKMGLKTVGDLKENAIFSKKTLAEFINRTKN